MNTYLAYMSNRTYVFQDYLWRLEHYPWANHSERPHTPRTPLNALISGPSAGGAWDPTDPFPRSISDRFLDKVCPPSVRRIINTRDIKPPIYWEQNGRIIFETWRKLLLEAPERCIEIQPDTSQDNYPQTFDLWFWGSGKNNDLWEEYRDSAVSRLLKPSPVVESAVARNVYLLSPRGPKPPLGVSNEPFDRMLAVHLRRGDYQTACLGFAQWNSTFYSWNLLSFLPDKFHHPSGWDADRNETITTYMRHCFPTEVFITNKIRESRRAYIDAAKPGEVRYLDTVYILTNEQTEWTEQLKRMLYDDGWNHVVTTRQLELDSQQKDVGMAVDMDLARRAAVFIGNGVGWTHSFIFARTYEFAFSGLLSRAILFIHVWLIAKSLLAYAFSEHRVHRPARNRNLGLRPPPKNALRNALSDRPAHHPPSAPPSQDSSSPAARRGTRHPPVRTMQTPGPLPHHPSRRSHVPHLQTPACRRGS
jgi:hypothetical protein